MFNLPAVERAFLDAAVDPSRWSAAMEIVGAATSSVGGVLLPSPGTPVPGIVTTERLRPLVDDYVRGGWHMRDLRTRGWQKMIREGVATDLDAVTSYEMRSHEYYREFLEPHRLQWFAGVKFVVGDRPWVLSIQRSIAHGPFTQAEQVHLQGLSRTLASAGALVGALGFARVEAALAAFEACGTAAMMLDRSGDVVRMNDAAERLLGPDLQVIRARITPANRDDAAALDRALNRLLWQESASVLGEPVVLRRSEGAPLLAYPMRLESVARDALAPCRAMLLLRDLGERPRPPLESLRAAYRLTPAEARLAQRIAGGESIESAAEDLGIAVHTARTQLKSVFSKTGAARQSQLVALMARMLTAQDR